MMEIRDFIGLGIAGILSVLWLDIRSIGQNKAGYLKEEKHELLCANTTLRLEKKMDEMKAEIITEIHNNGKRI